MFIPSENSLANAYAAVYEIVNNERQVVYTVEGLTSFAYESNFRFSADLTHFARTFPAPGMPAFEVFANGVKTRVVMRNDFIEDYDSTVEFTSIGPAYMVNWRIEEHPPYNDTIIISTSEDNTFIFDLMTARFDSEYDLPDETLPEFTPVPILKTQPSPDRITEEILPIETLSEAALAPILQDRSLQVGIIITAGPALVFIGVGVFFFIKRKKVQ